MIGAPCLNIHIGNIDWALCTKHGQVFTKELVDVVDRLIQQRHEHQDQFTNFLKGKSTRRVKISMILGWLVALTFLGAVGWVLFYG